MKLEGIHHITAITADAQQNVDFYAGVLGLRLVKKSVNQDDTSVYHLFYADETGDPGSDITFFEYPGVPRGRAGAGMIHRIVWRVSGPEALDFWADRLADTGTSRPAARTASCSTTPRASTHELRVVDDARRAADRRATPRSRPSSRSRASTPSARTRPTPSAARTCSRRRSASRAVDHRPERQIAAYEVRGDQRGGFYLYDPPPARAPAPGRRHASTTSRGRRSPRTTRPGSAAVTEAGARATPIIDRFYFRSIYFREPSGRAVRDRDDRPRVHGRRAARPSRREAVADAAVRAPARPDRADADAAREPARQLGEA